MLFSFVIIIYALFIYFIVGCNINNIYIFNNSYLTDQEIIELAEIDDYPNYYTLSLKQIENKIKKNTLVKDVKVKRNFFKQIKIYVEEYKILLKTEEKYVLSSLEEVILDNDYYNVPILINYVPNTKMESLKQKLNNVSYSVLDKISEIKYDPTEVDPDRFLLYMNDDNYVYVTLTKFDLINKYNETLEQLEGKKGILYLDSGNYFKIME